jgi:hypothetical protein
VLLLLEVRRIPLVLSALEQFSDIFVLRPRTTLDCGCTTGHAVDFCLSGNFNPTPITIHDKENTEAAYLALIKPPPKAPPYRDV